MRGVNRRRRELIIHALEGSSEAHYRLGVELVRGKDGWKDPEMGRLFLRKAARMGNEKAYLLYHHLFSQGKKVIDDASYVQICQEYKHARTAEEKQRLKGYLRLGTREQKKNLI